MDTPTRVLKIGIIGLVAGPAPAITQDAEELCASPDVDVVMVMSNYEDHVHHTTLALKHNKYVMVEKPMAMSLQDADTIIAAEQSSTGKVFVGHIRRYAPAFLAALDGVGGVDKIQHHRAQSNLRLSELHIPQELHQQQRAGSHY
ncbi:hypothetical protein V2G26_002172 [Clonostachys chloroleuca]